ncbi:MAG: MASE1 domain-containing protein [Candidatus Sulfotelmatobacter sp.]
MIRRMLLFPVSTRKTPRVYTSKSDKSPDVANRILPVIGTALLVGISYYVGTRIGFAWTPSGRPNSTFWPPNAILLAALLVVRRKEWWTLLLAVLAGHMAAQLPIGVPVWTAAGWFVTNTSEALIGAYCITRFTDSQRRLDGVSGVLIFVIFGVLFAPLATSFLDAFAVVITHWGRDYWPLSIERFWTNALAELTIVPPIVLCFSKPISWTRRTSAALLTEAALLTAGTVLAAVMVFGLPAVSPATTPALLYVPLPFLLWAAARFGLGGLSLSLLSLTLISTWYTMHGRQPFPNASMSQNILSLQILFCVVAVPLMFLSAIMAEARRTQELLRKSSGTLIEAQEQERHRIARELHDDLGQALALTSVTLDSLIQESGESLTSALTDLKHQLSAIANTAREISHGLYPTQLEYLGLAKALKRLCDESRRAKSISIHLTIGNLPDQLHPSISLSLYRIAQETMHNIITHSQARNAQVELDADDTRITLRISDDGVGFDPSHETAGLGLESMRQRVRAVEGFIDVSSSHNSGTRVEVRMPFREPRSDDVPGAA